MPHTCDSPATCPEPAEHGRATAVLTDRLTVNLCRSCLEHAADVTVDMFRFASDVLPGIAGTGLLLSIEFTDRDPFFSWFTGTCDGRSEACQRLAGEFYEVTAYIDQP